MRKINWISNLITISLISTLTCPLVSCGKNNDNKKIYSIDIENKPITTVFNVGDKFNSNGLSLIAHFNTGDEKITSGFTTNYDNKLFTKSDIGKNKAVTVSYQGKTAFYEIEVKNDATGIQISSELLNLMADSDIEKFQLISAKIEYKNNLINDKITWTIEEGLDIISLSKTTSSSDEEIIVKAKKRGRALIKAHFNGFSKTCVVNVNYSNVVIVDKEKDNIYKADLETICPSTETSTGKIKGTLLENGQITEWERDEFNCEVIIGDNIKTIDRNFLSNCSSFNQQIIIPKNVTIIKDHFLSNCSSFNQTINVPSNVKTIENYFLNNTSFNQEINISEGLETIGFGFLEKCPLNKNFTLPSTISWIGANFMSLCTSFNKTIDFSLINPDNLTFSGNSMFWDVPETNKITLKVSSGTKSTWLEKFKIAANKVAWPIWWSISEN